MSRLFELDVKPLRGYGLSSAILKAAVSGMVDDFYQVYTDPQHADTINPSWFKVSDYPEENLNDISAFFYCKSFLEAEAKFILKKLSIRIAKLSPETPFTGEIHMTDESNGYSWTYMAEYHNHLLSVRGVGMWDYPENPDTEHQPGCCPDCGEFVIGCSDYHPDNDQYRCPKCKQLIPHDGIWWDHDYNNCLDLSYYGEERDTILLCDINEHKSIVDLKIPEGITYIPLNAFFECEKLETLSLPSSLLIIDEGAFAGCVSLKEVALPSRLEYISSDAFSGCTSLSHVDIPNGLKTVDFLRECSSLESITVPGSVKVIDSFSFSECTSLASVDIEAGVERIYGEAFRHCIGLKEVLIPVSVIEIDDDAFERRIWKQLTIITPKGSYAEKWASEHGIRTQTE